MNKEFYQNRIGIFPIFWGSRRKERDLFFFTSQVESQEEKKKRPPLFQLYRYPLYRSFSASSREDGRDYGSIKEKKRVSDQREIKNNQIQSNEKKSSLFGFEKRISHVVENVAHDRGIQDVNVPKKWQGNWSKKKGGVLDQRETKNKLSQGNKKESSLDPTAVVGRKPTQIREIKGGNAKKGSKDFWSQEKKRVLDQRDTKNNLSKGNRKESNLFGFEETIFKPVIGGKSAHAHDREIQGGNVKKKKESTINSNVISVQKTAQKRRIKGGNVQKKKNNLRSQEKKAVSDIKEETINKARAGFRFSTLAKNNRMSIKKKYGHRVKVFFGRARGSLKALFLKSWNRGFRKQRFQQRFLFLTRKGGLKRKLYRNIKRSKQLFTVGKKRIVTSRHLVRAKRVEYRKYKKRKRRPKNRIIFKMPPGGKKGLIALKGSYNNIILTLTDTDGKTKAWVSAGTAGFKNGQKSSHVAAEAAVERLVDKSIEIGYQFVKVKMKGMGGGKLKAIRRLCKSRLKLIGISDHFLIPHNGCRRARKPRN